MNSKNKTYKYKPKMKDLLTLPEIWGICINHNGNKIAYYHPFMNLRDNYIERHCYIYDNVMKKTYKFTKSGTQYNLKWVDNNSLTLARRDENNDYQIFFYENLIGEGQQITFHAGGINSYEIFNRGIIFVANNPKKKNEFREKKYGQLIHFEEEESRLSIYYTSIDKAIEYKKKLKLTSDTDKKQPIEPIIEISKLLPRQLSITNLIPSTNSNSIFINCKTKDDLEFELETSCFQLKFEDLDKLDDYLAKKIDGQDEDLSLGKIVEFNLPKGATIKAVSPDGSKIIVSHKERDLKQYTQADLWIIDLENAKDDFEKVTLKKHMKCITRDLDQEPLAVQWTKKGIFVTYWNESINELVRISENGKLQQIDLHGISPFGSILVANEDGMIIFTGASNTKILELYMLNILNDSKTEITRITKCNDYITNWDLGTVESIRWKSKDGTEIEGILRKPSDFDSKKKYPLLFFIHGGPAWVSPYFLLDSMDRYYYPTIQLMNEGVLICMVNYRGSLGRGQWFKELGVDNLGIGDMWDIESAIDYLSNQGFIDETRIGAMGWSQGGFISAFLGMHSKRFKAVSVGAGVSSWYTFYISSDVRHSLNISGSPVDTGKKEIYNKTAPISGIDTAETPMLLQHGQNDQRIGLVSAMELYRSLKDKGIQTELFIYPEAGHGVSKPRHFYSIMVQNYQWFMHHFFDTELDFLKDDTED
jgi:dipeptidyl aminopeptidase/acylaminoacyl peptidase